MATTDLRVVSGARANERARNLERLCSSKAEFDALISRVFGDDCRYSHEMLLEDASRQRMGVRHVEYGVLATALSELEGRNEHPSYSLPDAYFFFLECPSVSHETVYYSDLQGRERILARFINAVQSGGFAAGSETEAEFRRRMGVALSARQIDDTLLLNRLFNRYVLADAPRDDTSYPTWADANCQGYLTAREMERLVAPGEDSFLKLFEEIPTATEGDRVLHQETVRIIRLLAQQATNAGPDAICIAHLD